MAYRRTGIAHSAPHGTYPAAILSPRCVVHIITGHIETSMPTRRYNAPSTIRSVIMSATRLLEFPSR